MNRNENNLNPATQHNVYEPSVSEVPQKSLLQIIWLRHWMVLLAVVVCLAGAFVYLYKATPIYTTASRLYVEQSGPKIMSEQEGFMTQSKNYLYTQCALITSTPILADVVDRPEITSMKTFGGVDNPIAYFKKNIDVSVGKKDDIITVSFESAYPKEAAQIVNAVVDSYITYHASRKSSTATELLKNPQKVF